MKKILLVSFFIVSLSSLAQNPQNFLQPKVWFKADAKGSNPELWEDLSGNGFDGIASDTSILSKDTLVNFNPAVLLDGENDDFKIPVDLSGTSQLTILAVYNSNDTSAERSIWQTTIKPEQDIALTTQRTSGPQSIVKYSEGNMALPVLNTTTHYWGKPGDGVESPVLMLGGSIVDNDTVKNFSGGISELMVFDRLAGGVELQILQSYLSLKYGTTFQYTDYRASSGELIWDYNSNGDYSSAIAGIGRDDFFNLYQKQSGYAEDPDMLVIGAGGIAESNAANNTEIDRDNYLIWGMNSEPVELEKREEDLYPYKFPVLERRWLMTTKGKNATELSTELRFDTKEFSEGAGFCYLVIDRAATEDFSAKEIEYLSADSISADGIAYFNDIIWDKDGSGQDIFTFSFGMDNGVSCKYPLCHDDPTGVVNIEVMGAKAPYSFVLESDSLEYRQTWKDQSRFQTVSNLKSGKYKLTVTDVFKKSATDEIVITNPEEFTTGLDSLYTLELGKSIQLDAGKNVAGEQVEYTWINENGFYDRSQDVMINEPGNYTVTIINQYGCTVSETIHVKPPRGMQYHYSLYPNPSSGHFNIDVSVIEQSPVKVGIYTLDGELVRTFNGDGLLNYQFEETLGKAGVYIVKIETRYGVEAFKLVVHN